MGHQPRLLVAKHETNSNGLHQRMYNMPKSEKQPDKPKTTSIPHFFRIVLTTFYLCRNGLYHEASKVAHVRYYTYRHRHIFQSIYLHTLQRNHRRPKHSTTLCHLRITLFWTTFANHFR